MEWVAVDEGGLGRSVSTRRRSVSKELFEAGGAMLPNIDTGRRRRSVSKEFVIGAPDTADEPDRRPMAELLADFKRSSAERAALRDSEHSHGGDGTNPRRKSVRLSDGAPQLFPASQPAAAAAAYTPASGGDDSSHSTKLSASYPVSLPMLSSKSGKRAAANAANAPRASPPQPATAEGRASPSNAAADGSPDQPALSVETDDLVTVGGARISPSARSFSLSPSPPRDSGARASAGPRTLRVGKRSKAPVRRIDGVRSVGGGDGLDGFYGVAL
jgi:hypothetical protein